MNRYRVLIQLEEMEQQIMALERERIRLNAELHYRESQLSWLARNWGRLTYAVKRWWRTWLAP